MKFVEVDEGSIPMKFLQIWKNRCVNGIEVGPTRILGQPTQKK